MGRIESIAIWILSAFIVTVLIGCLLVALGAV